MMRTARFAISAWRSGGVCASALLLLWSAGGEARSQGTYAAPVATAAVSPPEPASDRDMQRRLPSFLAGLWTEARTRNISRAVFDRAFAGLTLDPEILERLADQPEHSSSVADYVARLASPNRIEAGRRKLTELAGLVQQIEATYGVDRHVLLAIWGVESSFGSSMGTRPVVRSLSTLAIGDSRRAAYWRRELLTVLSILQRGDITAERATGSWAGAMGHTQFMPASYAAHAVDFDGDGRRDIWTSVADALASAASFLKSAGWRPGEPWGYEAVLPAGFDFAHSAPARERPVLDWMALGATPPAGRKFVLTSGAMRLVLPAGAGGPAFLVGRNFRAILRYNNSVAYALAVGHLADRIAGAPPLAASWPTGERALDRAERQELQQLLVAHGLEPGGVDGLLGTQTKAAIRAFQIRHGLAADGHPDVQLLERLRGGAR